MRSRENIDTKCREKIYFKNRKIQTRIEKYIC